MGHTTRTTVKAWHGEGEDMAKAPNGRNYGPEGQKEREGEKTSTSRIDTTTTGRSIHAKYVSATYLLDEVVDPDLLLRRHEEEGLRHVEPNALHFSLYVV